ncbi:MULTISPECIES: MarR family winged helix-turn-helix transcriptional regulator [Streptomyces]|uniref:MarR family winged helix-turn-helix transcriptional regulator n=1 Tax=Streptomyces ramulosus TaxID=47762 RepID=A0ABW1FRA2_9ACTN
MPHTHEPGKSPRVPTPAELEVIGLVPLLEPFFRVGAVRGQMPEKMREAMEANGLTARHGAVLPQLLSGGPLTVGEIARRLHVSLPTASELVGALNRAGMVTRTEDPANRRRILVSLADAYRPPLETFVARRSEPLLRALDALTPEERAGFLAGLTGWVREIRDSD